MQYDVSTPTIYLVAYFQISNGIQNDSIVKITDWRSTNWANQAAVQSHSKLIKELVLAKSL